jgi:hypothetical protein
MQPHVTFDKSLPDRQTSLVSVELQRMFLTDEGKKTIGWRGGAVLNKNGGFTGRYIDGVGDPRCEESR